MYVLTNISAQIVALVKILKSWLASMLASVKADGYGVAGVFSDGGACQVTGSRTIECLITHSL